MPIELKKSVRFGRPSPPTSLGEKISFFGKVFLFPPFMKLTKNFSIFLKRFLIGGGNTAARCVNLDSEQVFAILALPKCDVLHNVSPFVGFFPCT